MSSVLAYTPNDGYTEAAYIAEVKRLHPAVRFTFRPIQQQQRMRLMQENGNLKTQSAITANTCKVVAAAIKSWDLVDVKGGRVPVSGEVIGKLKPALYERLFSIVFGLEPFDEDPEAPLSPKEQEESLADQLAAAEKQITVGEAKEARDGGN